MISGAEAQACGSVASTREFLPGVLGQATRPHGSQTVWWQGQVRPIPKHLSGLSKGPSPRLVRPLPATSSSGASPCSPSPNYTSPCPHQLLPKSAPSNLLHQTTLLSAPWGSDREQDSVRPILLDQEKWTQLRLSFSGSLWYSRHGGRAIPLPRRHGSMMHHRVLRER